MSVARDAPQCREWLLSPVILIAGFVTLSAAGNAGPKDDVTGTVSKTEPALMQDGTPAHPFADAYRCPASTDLIIWPNGRAIPSIPPGISVCFVGNQSFNEDAPAVQVRQR